MGIRMPGFGQYNKLVEQLIEVEKQPIEIAQQQRKEKGRQREGGGREASDLPFGAGRGDERHQDARRLLQAESRLFASGHFGGCITAWRSSAP